MTEPLRLRSGQEGRAKRSADLPVPGVAVKVSTEVAPSARGVNRHPRNLDAGELPP